MKKTGGSVQYLPECLSESPLSHNNRVYKSKAYIRLFTSTTLLLYSSYNTALKASHISISGGSLDRMVFNMRVSEAEALPYNPSDRDSSHFIHITRSGQSQVNFLL